MVYAICSAFPYVVWESVRTYRAQIDENRRMAMELEQLNNTDTLTGLKNRHMYTRLMRKYDVNPPRTLGGIVLDINGMGAINDTHGIAYGDRVLKRTAEILTSRFSEGVYRTGGDEFVVLCENISKEVFQQQVVALRSAFDADKICDVSIGFAWNQDRESIDIEALRQQAFEMRRVEKHSYYHTMLSEGRTAPNTGFTGEILKEIEDHRFVAYYQPQVNIKKGAVVGAEALVRKFDEDGNLVPPGKFIPFYEASGVISYVDLFVQRSACAALRQWRVQGHDLRISVNFSRITLLQPHIVGIISKICSDNDVPSSSLVIEVTESIGRMDSAYLKELIHDLKAMGFSISLDDFGSQYSNLAILSEMDFDEIKFDRSLVSSLEENEKSRVVIKNSVGLCRDLKSTSSLAEGIETLGQLELLTGYHCDYGQGCYFSKPLPQDAFDAYIKQHS